VDWDQAKARVVRGQRAVEALQSRFNGLSGGDYGEFRQTTNSLTGIATGLKYYESNSDQLAFVDPSTGFTLADDLFFVGKAYFLYDKLDDNDFPLRGFSIHAEARAINNISTASEGLEGWFYNADLEFLGILPLGKTFSIGAELQAGGFLEESILPYRYYLGGNYRNLMNNFKPFPGLYVGDAAGENLRMGELFGRIRAGGEHYFTLGGRVARLGLNDAIPTSIHENVLASGRVTYGYQSPLGPIELTYAHGNIGGELYFNLGYWF